MNKLIATLILGCIIPAAQAEQARVLSAKPIYDEFPVQKRVCTMEEETIETGRSPAGAIIGGVAGGVLGHTVGKGSGKQAATAVGAIAGAIIGDRVGNRDVGTTTRPVERCEMVRDYEERIVGYRVAYEYAGKRYVTRMERDPGDWVELKITVVGGRDYDDHAQNDRGRHPRRLAWRD